MLNMWGYVCNNICLKHGINVRLNYYFILFIQYSFSVCMLFQNVLYLVPPLEDYESPSSLIKLPMGGPAQHLNATLALQLCNIWLQSETKGTSNIDMIDKQWAGIIIVAVLQIAIIKYSSLTSESVFVCVHVSVCVCVLFLHDNSKSNRYRNVKFEFIVLYENKADKLDI